MNNLWPINEVNIKTYIDDKFSPVNISTYSISIPSVSVVDILDHTSCFPSENHDPYSTNTDRTQKKNMYRLDSQRKIHKKKTDLYL